MFVSIIIPTFNRAKALDTTLASIELLLKQTKFDSVEVLVIDNGSTDHTKQICDDRKDAISHLKYFYEPVPGLLSGRHRGAKEANGEILCFIDDDVELSLTWLDSVVHTMNTRPEISLMTGPTLPKYETSAPDWLDYFWSATPYNGKACTWLSLMDLGNDEKVIDANYIWGLNFTIRKEALLELGGFHPDNIPKKFQQFQGDGETGLTMKANKKGLKAFYHPGVMLYHHVPASRLTHDYFDQRAFYQGVANSYTSLRAQHGLYENGKITPQSSTFEQIKKIVRPLKHLINGKRDSVQESINLLQMRFVNKQKEGFQFHQAAFEKSTTVKEWVLRENYFDYKLPEL